MVRTIEEFLWYFNGEKERIRLCDMSMVNNKTLYRKHDNPWTKYYKHKNNPWTKYNKTWLIQDFKYYVTEDSKQITLRLQVKRDRRLQILQTRVTQLLHSDCSTPREDHKKQRLRDTVFKQRQRDTRLPFSMLHSVTLSWPESKYRQQVMRKT